MQERHRLEVASLEQRLSSYVSALEAKNTELRESRSDKESLEAKLDEEREDARRVAEELKGRLAASQSRQESLEAKLREKGDAEPGPPELTPPKLTRIDKIVAKGLDEAVEDADGVTTFSQVTRSFSVTLHAELEVALTSILGR